jgi:rhamnosyltransferase
VSSIRANGVTIIIVDNGSADQDALYAAATTAGQVEFIALGGNAGIAKAQNIGIARALEAGADYIWLSDQDTTYPASYILQMRAHLEELKGQDDFAALGPVYMDTTQGEIQLLVRYSPFKKMFRAAPGLNTVGEIIASGVIIPRAAILRVGLMREDLFIDMVDLEWCWRAINVCKMRLHVAGDVQITHSLGDSFERVGGKTYVLRSPTRHYYMVRNTLGLALYSSALTAFQRLEFGVKAFRWAILYPMAVRKDRWLHAKATLQGLCDGLVNKLGPRRP